MPEGKRTFKVGESIADIPAEKIDGFMQTYPDAIEVKSFIVDKDTADIPLDKVDGFLKAYPNAKPLFSDNTMGKPKPEVGSATSSGGESQSKNFDIAAATDFALGLDDARRKGGIAMVDYMKKSAGDPKYSRVVEIFKKSQADPNFINGLSSTEQDALKRMTKSRTEIYKEIQTKTKNRIAENTQKLQEYQPIMEQLQDMEQQVGALYRQGRIAESVELKNQFLAEYEPILGKVNEVVQDYNVRINQLQKDEAAKQSLRTGIVAAEMSPDAYIDFIERKAQLRDPEYRDSFGAMLRGAKSPIRGIYNTLVTLEQNFFDAIGQEEPDFVVQQKNAMLMDKLLDESERTIAESKGMFTEGINRDNAAAAVGNILGFMAVGSATGGLGTTGSTIAMGSIFYGDTYDAALEAGFTKKGEAAAIALTLSGVMAVSEKFLGSGRLVKGLLGETEKLTQKELIKQILKQGKEQGFKNFKDAAKNAGMVLLNTAKETGIQGVDEGLQAAFEVGAKSLANEVGSGQFDVLGVDQNGNPIEVNMSNVFDYIADNALAGAVGGSIPSLIVANQQKSRINRAIIKTASDFVLDPSVEQEFLSAVDRGVAEEKISESDKKIILTGYEQAKMAALRIPKDVVGVTREKMISLVSEKARLQEEMKNLDEAFLPEKQARMDAINAEIKTLDDTYRGKVEQAPIVEEVEKPLSNSEQEKLLESIDKLGDNEINAFTFESIEDVPASLRSKAKEVQGSDLTVTVYGKGVKGLLNKMLNKGEKVVQKRKPYYVVSVSGAELRELANKAAEQSTPMPEGVKVEGANTQTDEKLRNEEGREKGRQESLLEPENVGGEKAPSVSESLSSGGIFVKDGKSGSIRLDGQTVVFETKDEIIELGNKNEVENASISEFNIEKELPLNIEVNNDNTVSVDGKKYVNNFSNPQAAINRDLDGNVVSVNLETENGQKRTFRGQKAEEIAYQYTLKEFEQNATDETIGKLEEEVTRLEEAAAKPATEAKKRSVTKRNEAKPKAVEQLLGKPKEAAQTSAIKPEIVTEKEVAETAKKTGITPKNLRDLYNINRELFGLDRIKSFASAIAMDRMVGAMAKRAGVTKEQMYGRLKFEKASEEFVKGLSAKGKVLFQLVGENAQLAQDVRDNLQVARDMETAGKDAKTIRLATGWEKGKDGKWRYEIPDMPMYDLNTDWIKNRINKFERILAGSLFDSVNTSKENDIFSLYGTKLYNIPVSIGTVRIKGEDYNGTYIKEGGNGFGQIDIRVPEGVDIYSKDSQEKIKAILLHEIQHAIQDIEGFAKGGSPKQMSTPNDVLQTLASPFNFPKLNKDERAEAKQKTREMGLRFSENFYFDVISDEPNVIEDAIDRLEILNKISPNDSYVKLIEALDYKLMETRGVNVAFEKYKRLAGEVEARNVQTRMGMTPEQRRATTLQETEDVARDEQIVLFDSKGIQMQVDAWHGSPYQFDKFTTEKIGTGEGAQAFGWGLYFTDLESIARDYANKLSNKVMGFPSGELKLLREYKREIEKSNANEVRLRSVLSKTNTKNIDEIVRLLKVGGVYNYEKAQDLVEGRDMLSEKDKKELFDLMYAKRKDPTSLAINDLVISDNDIQYLNKVYGFNLDGTIESVESAIKKGESQSTKNVYKVSLHKGKTPDQYTWLEWDKEVSDKIIEKINKQLGDFDGWDDGRFFTNDDTVAENDRLAVYVENGKQLYEYISKQYWKWEGDRADFSSNRKMDKDASLFLLDLGIDGIKYPAESISRGATSDTARGFNYVVFDENAVSIEEVIKFQKDAEKARGAMMISMDGQAVIYALTDPNVSTPLHEMAHVFEHYLTDAERTAVQSWAGTKAWTTKTSEAFARGFEKYLAEGKAPTTALQKIFEKFKQWLTDIYNGITKSEIDIELNEQMRDIYAKMLGAKATAAAPKAEVSKQVQPESKAAAAPELADVESTAKALDEVDKNTPQNTSNAKIGDRFYENYGGSIRLVEKIENAKDKKGAEIVKVKDVQTGKVYEHLNNDSIRFTIKEKLGYKTNKELSEAYHKAKADGSNPELVKAVEDLLTPKTEQDAKEQQSFSMREQSVQETTKRSSDSDLPKVNETKLSDGEKAAEQKEVAESKPKESAETKAERRKRELAELKKAASDVRKVDGIDAFEQAKRKALADRAILDFHIKNIKEDIGDAIKTIKDYAKSIGESIDEIMQDAWDVVTNNTPIPNKYNEPKKLRSASLATEINRTLRVKNAPVFVATQKAVNKAFAIGEAQAREEFVQSMKDLKSDFKEFIEYFTEQAKEEAKSKLDSKSAKFKAFREGQKAFAKVFNDTLKSAQEKNFITPFEYRMLARRASLAQTEGQWNKLMDLTNRVLSDASYRQKLAEAERLQKQAKQKKHGQATEEVKRFTRISPEDIDINKLDEYIAALGDLTLPIPKYGKMQAIVFDIEDNFRRSNPDLFTGRTDSSISGSEKVNKAFERASEAFDNVMESLNKDAITVDDYRYAVKQAGIALRNLDMVIADMRTMYEDGKLTSEALEEAENMYLDVLDSIGTSVADLSAKFPSQIDQLVTELVNQVNDNLPKIDKSTLTNSEKDMLKKLELYNSADLKKLSPIELDFYNQLIENFLNEGYFDMQRFKAVQSALFAATNKDKTVKFVNDIKQVFDDRFDNMPTTNRLAAQVSASWQGALTGFGKLFAGAFDVGFISPIMTSLKKADEETRKIVREFRDLQKKHGIQESPIFGKESYRERAHRIGMVAALLREHGLTLSGEPRKKDMKEGGQMEGERDVFRRLSDEKGTVIATGEKFEKSKDPKGEYDYGSKTEDKKLDKKIYKSFPKSKTVVDNGVEYKEVDPKEVYDSIFTDPNNKFLNAKERAFLIDMYELVQRVGEYQEAANAMRGLPWKRFLLYVARQRHSIGTKTIATPFPILKGGRISLRGSSGKEVVTEELSAMNNNIFDVFMQNAEETMRDYYVTSAVMDVNSLYKSVMPEIENDNGKYVKAMMDKISDSLNDHYIFPPKDIVQRTLNNFTKIGTFRIFVNVLRTAAEIFSFSTTGALRMGTGYKAYRNFAETVKVKSQVTALMNDVNSMFTGSMLSKDIEFKEGRIEAERLNSYFTRIFASAAESIFKRMLWYTRFQQEFKQKTGQKFDIDKYESSLDYRKKYREAIEEAKVQSDKSFEFITGSPVRAGRRKAARLLPIAGTKAVIDIDTLAGQALSLFSAYPFRGAIQAVDGLTDLKNEPSLKRANDAKNALLGTLGEQIGYGFAIGVTTLLSQIIFSDDDDEKKELQKELDGMFTLNELGLEALTSAVGMLSASMNGAGRILMKTIGTIAYTNTDNEAQKKMIVEFMQKVQYGKLTDYSKIKNDLKLKQAIYIDLVESSGLLGLTEVAKLTIESYNAYKDFNQLMDVYENGTPAQKEKATDTIIMMYLMVKAANVIGALAAFKGMAFNLNSKSLNQMANQELIDAIPSRDFANEMRKANTKNRSVQDILELQEVSLLMDADESNLYDQLVSLQKKSEIMLDKYKYDGEQYIKAIKKQVSNMMAEKLDSGGQNIETLRDYSSEQQLDTDKAFDVMLLFANRGDKKEKALRIALLSTMGILPQSQEKRLKEKVEGGYDNSYYTSILKNDAQTIFEFIKFMKKQNKS